MNIRGIDFARHTVIVGTDADQPVPNTALGQQPRGEMVARVLAASGSEATLLMNGQRVVVQTHVPLNAGDKLNVRVFQGEGGAVRLSILASAPDVGVPAAALAESDVDALLRELGLPTDERTRHAARALLARDGSLDRPGVNRLVADLRPFPQVTAEIANAGALLQKAGAPVTPATVAVVMARQTPSGPVAVGARLTALLPELEAHKRQTPARSANAGILDEAIALLKGLPLDEGATSPRVTQALRQWLGKLQPETAQQAQLSAAQGGADDAEAQGGGSATAAQGGARADHGRPASTSGQGGPTPAGQGGPAAANASATDRLQPPGGLQAAKPGALSGQQMAALVEGELPEAAADPAGAKTPAPAPAAEKALRYPEGQADTAKRGLPSADRVSASQHILARLGISTKAPEPAGSDLASMLERLSKGMGPEHQKLTGAIKEAVAELRYAQLANAPTQPGPATGLEFLIPLLVPQLSSEQPEGRIQVFHKPAKEGEPLDPQNVRLVFILETSHLSTIQADVTIKDGVVDLSLGVPDAENRDFLAGHLEELAQAIAKQGWETGRFGARLARGLPPRTRQEEGLSEIVRFDRRV